MKHAGKYIFGPVPSRRLGLSLGVDIVPSKVCTLSCIYCQLGKTTTQTIERKEYIAVEPVIAELKSRLAAQPRADFITLSGSGEPTLNVRLGEFIARIKSITDIPVAVLTNGTLFFDRSVRADCCLADVVLPSLDAADQATFRKINRPHADISVEKLVEGLCAFREEFAGRIWLEIFLVAGVNTDSRQILKIREAVEKIRPDKIQLNTAVRPTAEPGVSRLGAEELMKVAAMLGHNCEIIADSRLDRHAASARVGTEQVLSILKRRPCTLEDVCAGLGLQLDRAISCIRQLQRQSLVHTENRDGISFYRAE